VGIVVAGLGLQAGAISGSLYSVVVGMAVLSTLVVPPFLPRLLRVAEPEAGESAGRGEEDEEADDLPASGTEGAG
jgi:Kef-type K+ transport system membrane component KefB